MDAKADLCAETIDKGGHTPLHLAAWKGQAGAVRVLAEGKADLEAEGGFCDTPLSIAAYWNQIDCVKTLLALKCNAESTDEDGNTALHLAEQHKRRDIVRAIMEFKNAGARAFVQHAHKHWKACTKGLWTSSQLCDINLANEIASFVTYDKAALLKATKKPPNEHRFCDW
jgi:ankyrin repeat protein